MIVFGLVCVVIGLLLMGVFFCGRGFTGNGRIRFFSTVKVPFLVLLFGAICLAIGAH